MKRLRKNVTANIKLAKPLFIVLFILSPIQAFCQEDKKPPVVSLSKPNVLFIAIDDLNDWTGMLKGNPQAKTPHMEKLASRGMLFANAHCAAPACGPSRAAVMSGIRPSTSGSLCDRPSVYLAGVRFVDGKKLRSI